MSAQQRTVVFDVGGVIVRWQPLALMRAHLPQVAPEQAYAEIFQGWAPDADWVDFDLGRVTPGELAQRMARRTGYPLDAIEALIAAVPDHLQPIADSVALIERVRAAGHRLALLSNMPQPYADHLEQRHACFGRFEHRVWSGRVGLAKPQRAVFDHLQHTFSIDPAHAIFLDDHAGNIDAARRYGWGALHYSDAAQAAAALERDGWL
jgi:putative hydrolase of the HAD superfamily